MPIDHALPTGALATTAHVKLSGNGTRRRRGTAWNRDGSAILTGLADPHGLAVLSGIGHTNTIPGALLTDPAVSGATGPGGLRATVPTGLDDPYAGVGLNDAAIMGDRP